MSGPRPAVKSADEAAEVIWAALLDAIQQLEKNQRRSPSLTFDQDVGRIAGYVGALFFLTGEPHDSVRARARMVALTGSNDQAAIF